MYRNDDSLIVIVAIAYIVLVFFLTAIFTKTDEYKTVDCRPEVGASNSTLSTNDWAKIVRDTYAPDKE